jgi:SepF-like predicted cell division protein (DUF552 family)
LEVISTTREKVDFYIDPRGLSVLATDGSLLDGINALAHSGTRIRIITKITQENITYCKMLMKYTDKIFHLDNVKGNFSIIDGRQYIFFRVESVVEKIKKDQKQIIKQVLYNNDILFVDSQQHLFENLCINAILGKEKVREIERGFRGEFTEILDNASDVQRIAINSLDSASYEILILFSGEDSFYRVEYSGIINSLLQASQRGVIIKILLQSDDNQLRNIIQEIIKENQFAINIQYITKPLQNKMMTLVIDQFVSLAIEIGEDNTKIPDEKTVVAVYSNNDSTVSSCISIFETLWIQSEFDKQNKVRQAIFQIFKGLELKSETYHKNWSSSNKTAADKKGTERKN